MTNTKTLLKLKRLYQLKACGMSYAEEELELGTPHKHTFSDLNEVRSCVESCHLCDIAKTRKRPVNGLGSERSALFIITDFPTPLEENSNKFYSDNSGLMLKKIIERIFCLKTKEVYLTYALKCRPPENRHPVPSEIHACRGYLLKEIEIVKPKVILVLGALSYEALTEDKSDFNRIRGQIINFGKHKVITTYSPMYMIKNPSSKEEAWKDFLKAKELL